MEHEPKFYKAEIDATLRNPLMAIARAKGIEVRSLVSQVLRTFVEARKEMLDEIAKSINQEEGKKP